MTWKLPYYRFVCKLSVSDHSLKIKLFKTHTLWGTVKREAQRITLIQVTVKI